MAEQPSCSSKPRRKSYISRNSSFDSPDESISNIVLKSVKEKKQKKKERWLLTRKTWRYMADAGRKLIPDGSHNRVEDIPKIEAHFQELCRREPGFLLWRKNSYPGAFTRKSYKKRKDRLKGGYRKSISTDDFGTRMERPKDLPLFATSGGRTDMYKLSRQGQFEKSKSAWELSDEPLEQKLIEMLEKYLYVSGEPSVGQSTSSSLTSLDYQELMEKLQSHLAMVSKSISQPYITSRREGVHFEGDHITKSLAETLSRYFSQTPKRDKVISDFLTDRKALEKLYFELRQAKGFRSNRTGFYTGAKSYVKQWYPWKSPGKSPFASLPTSPKGREVTFEEPKKQFRSSRVQTEKLSDEALYQIEEEYKKALAEREQEERKEAKELKLPARRRSSVDNDDVSQSVSDTIKRYLRMARKKSVDADKNDRFKRINYDRNLRNIKAKGELTKPGDDDGLNKGCQTNDDWILTYRDLTFDDPDPDTFSDPDSCLPSSRNSIDIGNSESTHSGFLTNLSNLIYGKSNDKTSSSSSSANNTTTAMQKSKSSSSVVHHGSRLVAKKIFRSRSKSQTRASTAHLTWTPQGNCMWSNVTGRQVSLNDTTLLQLSEVERCVLRQVALAKLQALNLGVNIKMPTDSTTSPTSQKPKRRPYLLKRKALTTGLFEGNKKEGEKDGSTSPSGLVFGIPLSQCVENDRLTRAATRTSPSRQRVDSTLTRQGSRGSFSSLNEAPKDENGSCDSLMTKEKELTGSVPGLLDSISNYGSSMDINAATQCEEPAIPNILNVCLRHLQLNGLHTLGIFRVSTSKKRVRQLREDFDCGRETTLDDDQCPHDVATLIKEYLRDLPDPLLCKDLYNVFVQTQRIRNRRLQFEALQHLIQLLPSANRDTLWALLAFLADVARYSTDQTDSSGESIQGNKMDSNNLATVFAPNILHCNKPGTKDVEKPEDRIDVINVVRTLIDYNEKLFSISAELLDEVYVHMMDSHPEVLESLLNRRININAPPDDYADDVDSESYSAPLTPTVPSSHMSIEHVLMNDSDGVNMSQDPRRTWSREEFLHELAATGGPNIGMRIRHKEKERVRDKSTKKKREDGGITVISRMHSHESSTNSYKNRSSSMDSNSSQYDNVDISRIPTESSRKESYASETDGVIKASLTIPVQQGNQPLSLSLDHTDIPYIEDSAGWGYSTEGPRHMHPLKRATEPLARTRQGSAGSDSSVGSQIQVVNSKVVQGYDSALGSSVTISSPPHYTTPSSVGSSIAEAGFHSSPPSWASSPPTSPDYTSIAVNYIPEEVQSKITLKSTSKSAPQAQKISIATIPEPRYVKIIKEPVPLQPTTANIQKSFNTSSAISRNLSGPSEREQKFTTSISSIGNAVLKSRTADFERIAEVESKAGKTGQSASSNADKKKYTKRRYTDSRHPTKHIPDAEALESAHVSSISKTSDSLKGTTQTTPVYKRRELISSVQTK